MVSRMEDNQDVRSSRLMDRTGFVIYRLPSPLSPSRPLAEFNPAIMSGRGKDPVCVVPGASLSRSRGIAPPLAITFRPYRPARFASLTLGKELAKAIPLRKISASGTGRARFAVAAPFGKLTRSW
jgi:hypothetical protein